MGLSGLSGWSGLSGLASTMALYDQFTDANGTALTAHTIAPVNADGLVWLNIAGVFDIQSNRARIAVNDPGSQNMVFLAVGDADVVVEMDITTPAAVDTFAGALLRVAAVTSAWVVRINTALDAVEIYERAPAGWTLRASGAVTIDPNMTYRLRAIARGQVIVGYVDNVPLVAYASATYNQAVTNHGIYIFSTNGNIDNYRLEIG
jgi:hypothetical protein